MRKAPWVDAITATTLVVVLSLAACRDEARPSKTPEKTSTVTPTSASSGATVVTPPRGAGESKPVTELSLAHVPKDLPIGVSPMLYAISVPPDRAPTPALVALGDKLFNDKRL